MTQLTFGRLHYEYDAEAEAGVTLSKPSTRWWGSRIRYRLIGTRRWSRLLVLDIHPFDKENIETALRVHLANEKPR